MSNDNNTKQQYSPEHVEFLNKIKRRKLFINYTRVIILISFIALWELAAQLKLIDPFITSQPTRIIKTLCLLHTDGSLYNHTLITLYETIVGFVLGTVIGTLVAVMLWWSDFLSKVLDPYLVILNSLPKIALGPIIIVWVGNGQPAIIVMALLISVIVTIISVLNGFLEVSQDKVKLLMTFGANKVQILKKVILPSSVPTIISALKINIGLSWVGVIVGEFLVSRAGLGYLIVYGGQVFKLDLVMTSVIILSLLAAVMYQWVTWVENRFVKWRQ